MKQQTKQTQTTTTTIATVPDTMSLREQKLEAEVKQLTESLHDFKRMTINSHIQKYMYHLQNTKEWKELHRRINETLANEDMTVADRIIDVLQLQDTALAYIATIAYIGALSDSFNEAESGVFPILTECLDEVDPIQDAVNLDILPPFNFDTVRDIIRLYKQIDK